MNRSIITTIPATNLIIMQAFLSLAIFVHCWKYHTIIHNFLLIKLFNPFRPVHSRNL